MLSNRVVKAEGMTGNFPAGQFSMDFTVEKTRYFETNINLKKSSSKDFNSRKFRTMNFTKLFPAGKYVSISMPDILEEKRKSLEFSI